MVNTTEHLWGAAKVESCRDQKQQAPACLSRPRLAQHPQGALHLGPLPPSALPPPLADLLSPWLSSSVLLARKIQAQPLFLKQLFSSARSPREVQNFTRPNPCPQGAHSFFRRVDNTWETPEEQRWGTSLVVQWFRLQAPNARDTGSIPDQGTKIPACHTVWPKNKINWYKTKAKTTTTKQQRQGSGSPITQRRREQQRPGWSGPYS